MQLLRFVRQHPLALLGGIAVAFVGWVWWDALPARDALAIKEGSEAGAPPHRRGLPRPPGDFLDAADEVAVAPRGVPMLKPGMTRAEVEKLVGSPVDDRVSPATVANGRVTYRAAYEADFGPPPTVRPIQKMRHSTTTFEPAVPVRTAPPVPPVDRVLVTLEFDATKPGHPLLDIHYPDPLF